MSESLRHVPSNTILTGWDFSTSGVKCLAFDLDGNTVADVRLPTDLWTKGALMHLDRKRGKRWHGIDAAGAQ